MPKSEKERKTLDVTTVKAWRQWLAKHHASEREIWLVFYKKHTGRPSIDYKEALDEALCFGWIDSLGKRLDDERYLRKFTPRREDSSWTRVNMKRYAELEAAGRLMPAGLSRRPTGRLSIPPAKRAWPLPQYMEKALKSTPPAWQNFQLLAPSYRRNYIGWVDSAKLQETKQRRLAEAVRLLAQGRKLGLK